jgi:hypothetical protein
LRPVFSAFGLRAAAVIGSEISRTNIMRIKRYRDLLRKFNIFDTPCIDKIYPVTGWLSSLSPPKPL